jgi:hypothetical protein
VSDSVARSDVGAAADVLESSVACPLRENHAIRSA